MGAETVGMRTMLVPLELRPKEVEPLLILAPVEMGMRVTLEDPSETEEPDELPRVEPGVLTRGVGLGLEVLLLEPIEGMLPLELLLPLEVLPRELLPLALLLPLELLWEALEPLEPRWASAGTSMTKRTVARTKESRRSWRIAVPFEAGLMRDGHPKQRGYVVTASYVQT